MLRCTWIDNLCSVSIIYKYMYKYIYLYYNVTNGNAGFSFLTLYTFCLYDALIWPLCPHPLSPPAPLLPLSLLPVVFLSHSSSRAYLSSPLLSPPIPILPSFIFTVKSLTPLSPVLLSHVMPYSVTGDLFKPGLPDCRPCFFQFIHMDSELYFRDSPFASSYFNQTEDVSETWDWCEGEEQHETLHHSDVTLGFFVLGGGVVSFGLFIILIRSYATLLQ